MQDFHKVNGNEQVVDALEKGLARAQQGLVRCVGLIFVENNVADVALAGDERSVSALNMGCDLLKHVVLTKNLKISEHNFQEPPVADASLVQYDLGIQPACFDFVLWLVTAEMKRRREGCVDPLRVGFARVPEVGTQTHKLLSNVLRPSLELFGATEDSAVAPRSGRVVDFTLMRDIAKMHAEGDAVPQCVVPSEVARRMRTTLKGQCPVTLTLRETTAQRHRNSDLAEWIRFALWLREQGEDVIIVRDTELAEQPIQMTNETDINTFPQASLDLHVRAALYDQAKCNFFVTNGPWALAAFSRRPWILFATVSNNELHDVQKPEFWEAYMATNAEGQLPWALPTQRFVYERDTFDNMKRAWERLRPLLEPQSLEAAE